MSALLSAPAVAASALILVTLALWVGPWVAAVVAGLWVFVGVLLFDAAWFSPSRQNFATAFKFREPSERELETLTAAWENVTRIAQADGWPYSLWIEPSGQLNAYAGPTRIVAVTSWAVGALGPRRLEAVLAHELGHHLLVDQRVRLAASKPLVQRCATDSARIGINSFALTM
ncbi:M48 family metalloprotease [Nocardia puris]|uniref:Peptidase M48-like protein n=1 Tax=Nocardia puris TaxID=208602 RepID=A0A366CYV7_9NOCA|nr:M48 family metalloprotease [Nocardia puris]RBO83017.1 peptidase M48-like protein [Nocardia puris]